MRKPKSKYFIYNKSGDREYFGDYCTNESGIQPVEDKLLVLPDEPTEMVGSIVKPDTTQAQERMAQVRGLLVAVGGNCFEDWDEPIPTVGDRVMLMKYAGVFDLEGADGRKYQLITARDITAILTIDYLPDELNPRKKFGRHDVDTDQLRTDSRIVRI
jgi:co-chaperonin GroES (HSP10)